MDGIVRFERLDRYDGLERFDRLERRDRRAFSSELQAFRLPSLQAFQHPSFRAYAAFQPPGFPAFKLPSIKRGDKTTGMATVRLSLIFLAQL